MLRLLYFLNPKPNEQNTMQSIQTKYLSATDSNGSRIKAKCARGSITIPLDYGLSGDAIHRAAVMALVLDFADGLAGRLVSSQIFRRWMVCTLRAQRLNCMTPNVKMSLGDKGPVFLLFSACRSRSWRM